MASSFSANQYDSAFKSHRLQNWSETKHFKERPTAQVGHTSFIADNRGHLLPGVKKGRAFSDFKGTWDLPARIPARHINPTSRSAEGLYRLQLWGLCPQQSAKPHRGSRSTDVGQQITEDVQQGSADPSTAAEARPESQNHSVTESQRSGSQARPSALPAEQSVQATGNDRRLSQSSAKQEDPVSSPTAARETPNRSETSDQRPQSKMSEKTAQRAPTSSSRQTNRDIKQEQ